MQILCFWFHLAHQQGQSWYNSSVPGMAKAFGDWESWEQKIVYKVKSEGHKPEHAPREKSYLSTLSRMWKTPEMVPTQTVSPTGNMGTDNCCKGHQRSLESPAQGDLPPSPPHPQTHCKILKLLLLPVVSVFPGWRWGGHLLEGQTSDQMRQRETQRSAGDREQCSCDLLRRRRCTGLLPWVVLVAAGRGTLWKW